MATRVQTQLLPEAPNLQPTISAGGRYTVQVRGAPSKGKWGDLAEALSQVNPALREFTAAQKLEAEIFANEQLQRKPEEVLADLKKQAEPFNKMTRKGGLPLIGNPFAVMQNKRTMGQIAARAFRIELENELDVAPADETPEQTYQRVRQQFEQEHPRLVDENGQPALGTGDGFQAELNEYLPAVLRSSEKLRNEKAKAESRVVAAEGLASGFKQEGMTDNVLAAWASNTAHMTPAEQRTVISSVAKSLAQGGDNPELAYNEAMAFLNEAKNLPIGNAKLGSKLKGKDEGERVFSDFSTYISDVEAGLEDIMERRKRGQDDEDDKIAESVAGPIYDYIKNWKKTIEGAPTAAEKQALVENLFTEFAETSETHKRIVPTIIRQSVQTLVDMPKDEFFPNWYKFNQVGNPVAQLARTHKELADTNKPEFGTGVDLSELESKQIQSLISDRAEINDLMSNPAGYTLPMPDGYDDIVREGKQTDAQKTQDVLAWSNARLDSDRKELQQAYTDNQNIEKAITPPLKKDPSAAISVINGQPVKEQTQFWNVSSFDIEHQLNLKNAKKAKTEADALTKRVGGTDIENFDRIVAAAFEKTPIAEQKWQDAINSATTDSRKKLLLQRYAGTKALNPDRFKLQDTTEARKKVLMVLLAQGKLNEKSINEGKVELIWGAKGENQELFEIKDTEAVGALAKSYPILSTDFVQEFVVTYEALFDGKQDQDVKLPNKYPFNQARDVFKKIYGVSKISDEQLKQFVEQQYSLHKAFKTIQ